MKWYTHFMMLQVTKIGINITYEVLLFGLVEVYKEALRNRLVTENYSTEVNLYLPLTPSI